MRTLWQDFRFSFRMLWKNPTVSVVAIITLALGIGANTAIFSVVNSVLLRPLPYPEPNRLATIYGNFSSQNLSRIPTSVPEFMDYREQAKSFEHLAAYASFNANLDATDGVEAERIEGLIATHELFDTLGIRPQMGRAFTPEEDTPGRDNVVVLGYGLWQRRFGGNANAVGQSVMINGQKMAIIGVMPRGFNFPQEAELWVPFGFTPQQLEQTQRGSRYLNVIGRFKPGVSLSQAQAGMDAVAKNFEQQYAKNYGTQQGGGWAISVVPLLDVYVGDIRPALFVLLGAVGFVLLIACANVTNLLLARSTARQKEIAIRTALGAGRRRMVQQLLTESVLLALIGGVAGLLIAVWGIDLLTKLTPANLSRMGEVRIDGRVLGFTFVVSLLTGVVFGLAPALQASQVNPNETLKEGRRSGAGASGKRQRLRSALIVAEVALALVLLIGAGLMIKSFGRLLSVDPGFDANNVLTMRVPLPALPGTPYAEAPQRAAFYRQTLSRVAALPGVESASAISLLPLAATSSSGTTTAENSAVGPNDISVEADWRWVTPDYFKTLGLTLVKGRFLAESDTAETERVAVVDESFARRFYPNEDVIGKRVKRGGFSSQNPWMTVVGVVRHVKNRRLDTDTHVQIYFPYYQETVAASMPASMSLVVKAKPGTDPASLSASVRRAVQETDKNQPVFNIRTMRQIVDESVAQQRLLMLLLGVFALLAVVLAVVGLYGVMSYVVQMRTHEIGLRMALGAQRRDVLRMVIGQGMILTIVGIAIGLIAAFALTRVMVSLLYGVSATDPVTFVLVPALLAFVALAANYIPARRATKVDPMTALRYE